MIRRRISQRRWRQLIERQAGGGLPVGAFCARHHLAVSTFFAWRRRLAAEAESSFVELTTEEAARELTPASAQLEVLLPDGLAVRVTAGFDAGLLRQVIEALS
jgi:transposase-like protein